MASGAEGQAERVGQGEPDHRRSQWMHLPGGVGELEVAGPEGLEFPALLVQEVVMPPTDEGEVVEVGVAVVRPVDRVVGVAAVGTDGTPEDPAAVVAGDEEVELCVGEVRAWRP